MLIRPGDKVKFIKDFEDSNADFACYQADKGDTGVVTRVEGATCCMSIDGLAFPRDNRGGVHEFWAPLEVLEVVDTVEFEARLAKVKHVASLVATGDLTLNEARSMLGNPPLRKYGDVKMPDLIYSMLDEGYRL